MAATVCVRRLRGDGRPLLCSQIEAGTDQKGKWSCWMRNICAMSPPHSHTSDSPHWHNEKRIFRPVALSALDDDEAAIRAKFAASVASRATSAAARVSAVHGQPLRRAARLHTPCVQLLSLIHI